MLKTKKEIILDLCFLIDKLEKDENYYEIINLLFLSENLLDKELFNSIINNLKNKNVKLEILKKMINVNNYNFFNTREDNIIKFDKINFNKQLDNFIKKINFLN